MAKISKSYVLTRPHPHGHVMSVKCEQPLDELTVKVWLLYDHPNFKYCTLFITGRNYGRTDKQTNGRTDGRTIQTLDALADLSGRGHKKGRNQVSGSISVSRLYCKTIKQDLKSLKRSVQRLSPSSCFRVLSTKSPVWPPIDSYSSANAEHSLVD